LEFIFISQSFPVYFHPMIFNILSSKQKRNIFFLNIIVLFMISASSCTPHRRMVYLQHKAEVTDTLMFTRPEYRIKPGDILHIRVLTLDEESYVIFNNEESRQLGSGSGARNNISVYLNGFSVSETGTVQLPVMGEVKVSGKTVAQATEHIRVLLGDYLIGATVVVKIVNFSVSVMGEVRRPGHYYIYDNQITIMDALGLAGDLTDYGNRKVNIVRQTEHGAVFFVLDITDPTAITSEYYYLQPNDLVYVQPHWVKRLGFAQFPFTLVFSAITTTLLLINFFSN
jgi:polysaccharide biosynthesis/export protein